MTRDGVRAKRVVAPAALVLLVCLGPALARPADSPLSRDDLTLLLIGGGTPEKMIALIEKRGVDFQMNPDLAKKFHEAGATDAVIEALVRAGEKAATAAPAARPPVAEPGAAAGLTPATSPAPSAAAEGQEKVELRHRSQSSEGLERAANPPAARPAAHPAASEAKPVETAAVRAPNATPASAALAKAAGAVDLGDPSSERVQQIIQEFAAKEKLFREARDNYTYHQINKIEELDADGNTVGMYEQDWDIVYDDAGKRLEQVTYAPPDSLKGLIVTKEDLDSMRNVQPFVLTTDELPEYDIAYLGHVKVDEITAFVFRIRPREIVKGRQYFQGTVWVDDRDLQIVKSSGKPVPEIRAHKGQFNLFPRFTTYREQIDGKFWFPTFTMADDTLYFPGQPIHMKEIIKYSDYKQFKSTSNLRVVKEIPLEAPKGSPKNQPAPKPSSKP